MIMFDNKVKVCDRCYQTTCFELPMATGIMFSISMRTNLYCNDSKVYISLLELHFAIGISLQTLLSSVRYEQTNFDTNQKTVTVE